MQETKHDIRCDIAANRLVIDGVRRTDADFESRFQTAWSYLYPDIAAPAGEIGLAGMWTSSRVMLEVTDIRLAGRNSLITFVRERLLHYHMIHLKPNVLVSDVRSSVLSDLKRMNLIARDTESSLDRALRSYSLRIKPQYIDPERMNFNGRECALTTELYRYLVALLAVNAVAARPTTTITKHDPVAAAAAMRSGDAQKKSEAKSEQKTEKKAEANLPAVVQTALVQTKQPLPPAAALVKSEAQPVKEAGKEDNVKEAAQEPAEKERSGRRRRRTLPPEELEARTLRRLKGQFAIDLLMATRVEPLEEDILADDSDEDDSELEQFIEACAASTTYKKYTPEQCTELWNSVLNEDRILFARGSLTALVDLRFTIIASRCLMMSLVETKDDERSQMDAFIERAVEYCEAFRVDYKPEIIRERLKKLCKNTYLVKEKLPMSVLELLRAHKQDILDAYNLYVEQSDAEAQRREQEIARQVEELRRKDALRRRNDQHAETVRLIRDFGANELGWLCMAVNGLPCSKDNLLYQLDGILQKLEALGIEPFAADLAAEVFDGSDCAAGDVIDLSGHPLEKGVSYRLLQPGWKYHGEIVVWPKADRVK